MRLQVRAFLICFVCAVLIGCGNDGSSLNHITNEPAGSESFSDTSSDSPVDTGSGEEGSSSESESTTGLSTDASAQDTLTGTDPHDSDATDSEQDTRSDSLTESETEFATALDSDTTNYLVAPDAGCVPSADACAQAESVTGAYATYRKDKYLPYSAYPEDGALPVNGGRFHIAAISGVTGEVTTVRLDGAEVGTLLGPGGIEWYHVWPTSVVAGQPVWFAFHSKSSDWDSASTGHLTIETTAGTAVDADFSVAQTDVPLTYVTISEDRTTLLVHARNVADSSRTVSRLVVNGKDVTGAGIACLPESMIESGETVLWQIPLCEPAALGSAWTVVAEIEGGAPSVGVGRVLKPHYPVEAWPSGSDCPYPGGNQVNLDKHLDAGFDTMYLYWGGNCDGTGATTAEVVNTLAPARGDFYALLGDDFLHYPNPELAITDTTYVSGFLTGDESDGEVYDENNVPNASKKAADARRLWDMYPDLPVYNGAKTNKNIGSFAGMTDVQGIDFYVAACAPHITTFGNHPPLRGAYDYLRNARDNHMPLTTWMYAQGVHSGWNKESPVFVRVQPSAMEIKVQAYSVIAAGAKGIMWFQSTQEEASALPATWKAISDSNWAIRGVRDFLREGDITGLASSADKVIVEAVRARRALVVPIINVDHDQAPTDLSCLQAFVGNVPHWHVKDIAATVSVVVPDDFGVVEVLEVLPDGVETWSHEFTIAGRTFTFSAVPLSQNEPVRLLVLAKDAAVREDIAAALVRP